jgi:hypothetical protein
VSRYPASTNELASQNLDGAHARPARSAAALGRVRRRASLQALRRQNPLPVCYTPIPRPWGTERGWSPVACTAWEAREPTASGAVVPAIIGM